MLLSVAWHNAYLQRARDFPRLDEVLRRRRPEKPADTDREKRDLAERLKAALMSVRPTGRGGPAAPTDAPPADTVE